jgi:dTDP-4-amino-4,6-dideoxygalactose transaminase
MANFAFGDEREIQSAFGLNAKLSEMHAAIGLAVLDRFDDVLRARRLCAERLRGGLEEAGYRFQAGAHRSAWQFVPVLAPSAEIRDAVLALARQENIEIRSYHSPLHLVPALAARQARETLPVTEDLARRTLSLPLANDLEQRDIERILGVLVTCAHSDSHAGSPAEEVST